MVGFFHLIVISVTAWIPFDHANMLKTSTTQILVSRVAEPYIKEKVVHLSDKTDYADLYTPLSPKVSWYIQGNGEHWKQKDEDGPSPNFITILQQDHFK